MSLSLQFMQFLIVTREADVMDMVFDWTGIALGLVFMLLAARLGTTPSTAKLSSGG